jgi:hypothetical protein
MTSNKIVIKFIDGNVKKGTTNNFEPDKNSFSLKTIDGEQEEVHIVGIKSIFFVRDFEGKKHFSYEYKDNISNAGRKIQIEYYDGEIIIGYASDYSPTRQGFFIIPADLDGNNLRIYAVTTAIKEVQFLDPDNFKLL